MPQQALIYIWMGERLLLPEREPGQTYILTCISGSGLIRLMSRSLPCRIKPQQVLLIPADEVVTVSGSEDMVITLEPDT